MSVDVRRVGPESAQVVLRVVRTAFEARPALDPPASALVETVESMSRLLEKHGGLLATLHDEPVGALVLDPIGTTMYLRRFGVVPEARGHGIAALLIEHAVDAANGYDDLTVVAREELPRTLQFWERQGFREVLRESPNVELRRPLRTFLFNAPDAETMRELGRSLAGQLTAGDLLVLSGELGAGKTTFTQGLGEGLKVRGDVTSPTFVIARVHPSLVDGPPLVHVDAYRLGGIDELDDLDLDTALDEAVTVVEWGEGIAEGLAESRLEVRIIRALAHEDEHADLDPRRVLMTPIGPRWYEMEVPSTQREPLAEKLNENILLDFHPGVVEDELDDLDPAIPLRLSLLVAEHDGRVLIVHNSWRGEWELPGGEIREEETARETAVRTFKEETGAEAGEVTFVGTGTVQVGHERTIEHVALFHTVLPELPSFDATDEVDKLAWWDVLHDFDALSPIDCHLARIALGDEKPA
ncbi:tRNA (adenosine(37)-N6)-threonylcarbamoyltransferase complex ATPase subunit type 1 TsaE [Nocardioides sp. GCM10027113]|uniref:tRNA (adenosine(37)-N6)-threonylcarbamoyltransferase complex ATPase subunit type 1 TsaE n=1 Tax=unclassified Nocardioides TaxID=2615069 RepID=UPI0036088E3E